MSIRLMSQVWEREVNHAEQAVLLVLCDYANDDGRQSFPSVDTVAWKTMYSDRQVQRVLARLRARGALVVDAPASRYKPVTYRVVLSALPVRERPSADSMGDTVSPMPNAPDVTSGVTPRSLRGDTTVAPGVTQVSPDPSSDPSEDPPVDPPVTTTRAGEEARLFAVEDVAVDDDGELPTDSELARVLAEVERLRLGTAGDGKLTVRHMEGIAMMLADDWVPGDWICEAAAVAARRAKPWPYVLSILEDWRTNGKSEAGPAPASDAAWGDGRAPVGAAMLPKEPEFIQRLKAQGRLATGAPSAECRVPSEAAS